MRKRSRVGIHSDTLRISKGRADMAERSSEHMGVVVLVMHNRFFSAHVGILADEPEITDRTTGEHRGGSSSGAAKTLEKRQTIRGQTETGMVVGETEMAELGYLCKERCQMASIRLHTLGILCP